MENYTEIVQLNWGKMSPNINLRKLVLYMDAARALKGLGLGLI